MFMFSSDTILAPVKPSWLDYRGIAQQLRPQQRRDVFSSVCVSRMCPHPSPAPVCCLSPQHWRWLRIIFFSNPLRLVSLCSCRCRNDICRGTLFRPLQFFCKVRYVNWLTPPSCGGFACAACALPVTWLTPTLHPFFFQIWHSLPPLIRFPLLTVGTDYDSELISMCLQLLKQYADQCFYGNHFYHCVSLWMVKIPFGSFI